MTPSKEYNPQMSLEDYGKLITSDSVRRMMEKFPVTEIGAKDIKVSDWNKSVFKTKQDNDVIYITIPKNAESHADNLFFITLLKICSIKRWVPVQSETEVPPAVLETNDAQWFAGYVAAASSNEVADRETGSSKWSKGYQEYQLHCLSAMPSMKTVNHMRQGGVETATRKLSGMKGFTKEWWGLRGSVATMLKALPIRKIRSDSLVTYMRSKEDILRNVIKQKMPFQNGGIFRKEEISYLGERYKSTTEKVTEFIGLLNEPDDDLARTFTERYSKIRSEIKSIESQVGPIVAERARILFPEKGKKTTQLWASKPIDEKIASSRLEEKQRYFSPESLPGISKSTSSEEVRTMEDVQTAYLSDGRAEAEAFKAIHSYFILVPPKGDASED
jgi:hypothetical protein